MCNKFVSLLDIITGTERQRSITTRRGVHERIKERQY